MNANNIKTILIQKISLGEAYKSCNVKKNLITSSNKKITKIILLNLFKNISKAMLIKEIVIIKKRSFDTRDLEDLVEYMHVLSNLNYSLSIKKSHRFAYNYAVSNKLTFRKLV